MKSLTHHVKISDDFLQIVSDPGHQSVGGTAHACRPYIIPRIARSKLNWHPRHSFPSNRSTPSTMKCGHPP